MSGGHTRALNRLAKWRAFFAGWQLGTRPMGDPESDAVRDHREATLLMRAEMNAFVVLLVEKGVFSIEEFQRTVGQEADLLADALADRFPGVKATDEGLAFDARAADTMRGWKP